MIPSLPARPAAIGHAQIDAGHAALFDALESTLALPDGDFPEAFLRLTDAIEAEFRAEEQVMDSFACPDAHLHREQHARMQAGLHHAAAALMQGDCSVARCAASALTEWLPFHIATQDRHLVRALRRCRSQLQPAAGHPA